MPRRDRNISPWAPIPQTQPTTNIGFRDGFKRNSTIFNLRLDPTTIFDTNHNLRTQFPTQQNKKFKLKIVAEVGTYYIDLVFFSVQNIRHTYLFCIGANSRFLYIRLLNETRTENENLEIRAEQSKTNNAYFGGIQSIIQQIPHKIKISISEIDIT
jgi:hypothetical protein